jgi:uridine kinase
MFPPSSALVSPRPGISGGGKSTIALALTRKAREYGYSSACISMDDFFVSREKAALLPVGTLEILASSPQLCIREKRHDTNSPAAIDWPAFMAEIAQRRACPDAPDFLFVEGFLVFCKEGVEELATGMSVFDAAVFVSVAREVAMERKRARSYPHLSLEEFKLYFDTVTYPNYERYGRARPSGIPLFPFCNDSPALDAGRVDELLRKLLPVVVCVGDLHGWIDRVASLFENLRKSLPALQFNTADVVFLGDYVDRGPQSKQTIDWLISTLPREFPRQRHFFLAGNHELALTAALGDLSPPIGGFSSWSGVGASAENVWDGPGSERVHWQGRRYLSRSSGDIYDSTSTMASYDIDCRCILKAHGAHSPSVLQQELQKKVPQSHRDFLIACDWVIEFPARGAWLPPLTFVHAGLTAGMPISVQLDRLRAKDCRHQKLVRILPFFQNDAFLQ